MAMIAFACPECGKRLEIRDEHAGKKAKCPGCGAVLTVPRKSSRRVEQTHGEGVELDDSAAAVKRSGRGQAREQQARRIHSGSVPAPSVGSAGVGSKPNRHKLALLAVLLGLVVCTLGAIVGVLALRRFVSDRGRRVDVRKVSVNPQAYASQTLVSKVEAGHPYLFLYDAAGVALHVPSEDLRRKVERIGLAVAHPGIGPGLAMIKYRMYDREKLARERRCLEQAHERGDYHFVSYDGVLIDIWIP